MKTFNRFGVAAIMGIGLYGGAVAFGPEATAVPFPVGGPVCRGGVAVFIGPAGATPAAAGAAAAGAPVVPGVAGPAAPADGTLVGSATPTTPCGPEAADLTALAGPIPMALPGPLPAAPVVPVAPPIPVLPPPVPVVPGGPPPVPFVAPGPAGAAAASPIAGVLADAGLPVSLAGGTK